MKVTTLIMWDMTTGEVLRHEYHDYSGPWELAKGDDAAATAQERANKLQEKALDMQKRQLDIVNGAMKTYMETMQGFDPKYLKETTSQFLDQNAAGFNDASKTMQSTLRARGMGGGDLPVGGSFTRANSTLLGQEASSTAGGVRDINLANLQQMLTNRFNAASISAGLPAVMNGPIGTFGGMSSNALGDYIRAKNSPGFGNTLGQAMGYGVAGGLGQLAWGALGKVPGIGNFIG